MTYGIVVDTIELIYVLIIFAYMTENIFYHMAYNYDTTAK